MSEALVLDTSGWLRALAGDELYVAAFEDASALYVPGLVLAEVDYHLRHQRAAMHRLLVEVTSGPYAFEPLTAEDLDRAREIDRKFRDLNLGLVDASVAALCERVGVRRVLTSDSDFWSVRIGARWERSLDLVVPPPTREGQSPRRRKR